MKITSTRILDRLTSSRGLRSRGRRRRRDYESAASCRRRNINIYHKITFLATAHFITHIAAILTQDARMNYCTQLERAPIKRDGPPSRRYRPCVRVPSSLDYPRVER